MLLSRARSICWGLALGWLLLPGVAAGQLFSRGGELAPADIDEFDSNAATHLENSRRFLAEKQWDEAVEAIRRVMESSSSKFAPVVPREMLPAGFGHYVSLREYCQQRLAALHGEAPEALAIYRKLVDPLAESWLHDATRPDSVSTNSEELLRRIVEQAFASRWGDDALLRLGDLALARGQRARARGYWQRIAPGLTVSESTAKALHANVGSPLWLALREVDLDARWPELLPLLESPGAGRAGTYPDSDLDLAAVRARLVVVSLLEGALERAKVELDLFRRLHPEAEGALAGREGKYVELLDALFAEAQSWPAERQPDGWHTFAGNSTRNRVARGEADPAGTPLWSFPLPKLKSDRDLVGEGRLRVAEDMHALLSYHPLVVGQTVLLRVDARQNSYVTALDLKSGRVLWQVDYPRAEVRGEQPPDGDAAEPWQVSDAHAGNVRQIGVARYTLTNSGRRLFARMGSPVTAPQARRIEQVLAKDQGWLLGLDLQTEGKPLEGFPLQTEAADWSFEGTPVADAGHIYVAMRHVEGSRSQLHVACFDLQTTPTLLAGGPEARNTGRMRWRRKIASGATLGGGDVAEISHNLLTLHEGTIYCNTNLGAVAALSARDGRVRWLMKYPRGIFRSGDPDRDERHFFRDLTPCLVAGDLIVVAPSDSPRIFAVEAATGRLAWTLPEGAAADAIHLLGVGGDYLIASGNCLYWIDVHSGRLVIKHPAGGAADPSLAAPSPRGFGRGVLARSHIYWPTREAILVFQQQPQKTDFGSQPHSVRTIPLESRGATGGNLVIAEDVLLIATGDRLYAFSSPLQAPPRGGDMPAPR